MQKQKTKNDFKIGDYIYYEYMGTDYIKGRIIKLNEKEAEIEIGFCSKKSEDVHKEKMLVEYKYLLTVSDFINLKSSKNVM